MKTDANPVDRVPATGFRRATVAEIAEFLGTRADGDGSRVVSGIATMELAGPTDLTWLGQAKMAPRLAATKAAGVLLHEGIEAPTGLTVVRVADPDLSLTRLLDWLGPEPQRIPAGVDPTARVGPGAQVDGACVGPLVVVGAGARIGRGTQLHAGVVIGEMTTIGEECVIWPNTVIRERVRIGNRVIIHANSTIGSDGFGYLFRDGKHVKVPQIGTVVIEDDVEVGSNSAIDRAKSGITRIGRGTKIDNQVQIGHNCDIGEHCMIVGQCGLSGSCELGHHVVLAGQVGVIDHVRIAAGAQVAARSVVFNDITEPRTYVGYPAQEQRAYWRQYATAQRLPKLLDQVRDLVRRIERIEREGASADDPA